MTKYMILIYGDAQQWGAMTDEQWEANHAGHEAFVAKAGARTSVPLVPTSCDVWGSGRRPSRRTRRR
jgi:hypothetical protein